MDFQDELFNIAKQQKALAAFCEAPKVERATCGDGDAVSRVDKLARGSWLGYHEEGATAKAYRDGWRKHLHRARAVFAVARAKDFIQDRLRLPWDEFSRVPVAGTTNITRLSEMLDSAAIAVLVMTGEDESADGRTHARMNVVPEAGPFQGRLGFSRAIVLLEEGCEGFSNIEGLGQIRFPRGNIKAVFEEIRQVLDGSYPCPPCATPRNS